MRFELCEYMHTIHEDKIYELRYYLGSVNNQVIYVHSDRIHFLHVKNLLNNSESHPFRALYKKIISKSKWNMPLDKTDGRIFLVLIASLVLL